MLYVKHPVMFVTLVSNITVALFLTVKKHFSAENIVMNSTNCLNFFPKTISFKTSFLMLFTNLCKIRLLLIVFDHNLGNSKLENFFKVTQPVISISYVKTSFRNQGILHHDFNNFYNIFINATLNTVLFGFEFYSILSF